MTAITVRDVPAETRDELAARAARSGCSLEEYIRQHLIDVAERPDIGVVAERMRRRVDAIDSNLTTDDIIEWHDEERR